MEKEGLIRLLRKLTEQHFTIGELVTDRHPQVQKWMRDNMQDVKHYFDVWHVVKSEIYLLFIYVIF
jgi:hypothetical protein